MIYEPIRILIADDHPIVRAGLQTTLAAALRLEVVGLATRFADVTALLEQTPVHVLVLDLGGMGGAPLTLLARVRREHPQLGIVVFSSSVDLAPELLQAGARGYVVKDELPEQLLQAIYAVHAGQEYCSPIVQEYLLRVSSDRHGPSLPERELDVLKLMSQGLDTLEIAGQMGIGPRTVQNYVTTLRRKIGCTQRTQLVDWYRRMYGVDGSKSVSGDR